MDKENQKNWKEKINKIITELGLSLTIAFPIVEPFAESTPSHKDKIFAQKEISDKHKLDYFYIPIKEPDKEPKKSVAEQIKDRTSVLMTSPSISINDLETYKVVIKPV